MCLQLIKLFLQMLERGRELMQTKVENQTGIIYTIYLYQLYLSIAGRKHHSQTI